MKKFAILFSVLTVFFSVRAHAAKIYTNDDMYGLKDDSGKVIVKAEYENITMLQYTPVKTVLVPMQTTKEVKPVKLKSYKAKKGGLWGVLDENGKPVTEFKYDDIKTNHYGEIVLVKGDKDILLNPAKNAAKKTAKTMESIVGLPVTIVAGALMPVEVISKIGKK